MLCADFFFAGQLVAGGVGSAPWGDACYSYASKQASKAEIEQKPVDQLSHDAPGTEVADMLTSLGLQKYLAWFDDLEDVEAVLEIEERDVDAIASKLNKLRERKLARKRSVRARGILHAHFPPQRNESLHAS